MGKLQAAGTVTKGKWEQENYAHMLKSKPVFKTSPLGCLSARRWSTPAPRSLPSWTEKQIWITQTQSPVALGALIFDLDPWHPADVLLELRLCLSQGHRPLRFQVVLMISSPQGNRLPSFQCMITLGNVSFECTGPELGFKSDLAILYLHSCNEGISSKIMISEQLLKSSKRGANQGTLLCSSSSWKP